MKNKSTFAHQAVILTLLLGFPQIFTAAPTETATQNGSGGDREDYQTAAGVGLRTPQDWRSYLVYRTLGDEQAADPGREWCGFSGRGDHCGREKEHESFS